MVSLFDLDFTGIPESVVAEISATIAAYLPYMVGDNGGEENTRRTVHRLYTDLRFILKNSKLQNSKLYAQLGQFQKTVLYNGLTRRNSPNGIIKLAPDNNFIGGKSE